MATAQVHTDAVDLMTRRKFALFQQASPPDLVVPLVLAGYAAPNLWKRHRRSLTLIFGLFAFVYGSIFGLFGTFVVMQLAIPLVAMFLVIIWLLPNTDRAPMKTLTGMLFVLMVATICWPNYLAIAIPGLPWITINRLVTVPLATVMLVAISVSTVFQKNVFQAISAIPAVWKLVCAFALITLFSIAFSRDPSGSSNKFVVAQLSWTLVFFVATAVFMRTGNATRLAYTLWYCILFVSLLAFWEWRISALPWANSIPSFLKVEDQSVKNVLAGGGRAASGLYRVKSVFTTPLGLAEFLAFATPFVWYIGLSSRRLFVKMAAFGSIPMIFAILMSTDSRLGMIGFFQTVLLYILAWGIMRWRDKPEQMIGRIVVLTYPALASGFFFLSLFWIRLHNMIWGGGATIPSTEARKIQWASGIPKAVAAPWGHGIGQAGETLGHVGSGGVLTIDTYYLSILLEYGFVGFIVYFGMFLIALYAGTKALLRSTEPETRILVPLLIAIANFVVIKSVFSQEANHPIIFCFLGATVALVYRVQIKGRDPKTV
jgi:hypothetical protein